MTSEQLRQTIQEARQQAEEAWESLNYLNEDSELPADLCAAFTKLGEVTTALADYLHPKDYRYLLAHPDTSESYLGFGARFMQTVAGGMKVVRVTTENAEWQASRLASGLRLRAGPNLYFNSQDEAAAYAEETAKYYQ